MKSLTPSNYPCATMIWDYMRLNQYLQPVDVLIVPGSSDTSYLSRVYDLYHQGYSSFIICSGKGSPYMFNNYNCSEAQHFATILINQGVPLESIILEDNSTNTGENMRFSFEICKKRGRNSAIIIQKPFFERRAYATALFEHHNHWRPETIYVTSNNGTMEYYDDSNTLSLPWINMMVGDIHRLIVCNKQGRIIPQFIPHNVQNAMHELIAQGYDMLLMKGYDLKGDKI